MSTGVVATIPEVGKVNFPLLRQGIYITANMVEDFYVQFVRPTSTASYMGFYAGDQGMVIEIEFRGIRYRSSQAHELVTLAETGELGAFTACVPPATVDVQPYILFS